MPVTRRTTVRIKQIPLDIDEFNKLTDLLFEALKENHSACARVLGVSRMTWKKWEHTPPIWPWWNTVLRIAIKLVLTSMTKRGATKKHRRRTLEALSQIPHNDELEREIYQTSSDYAAAEVHLKRLLRDKGLFKDEIFTAANMGGYSKKALELGATSLNVIKTIEGYGKARRSYWRLPGEDD